MICVFILRESTHCRDARCCFMIPHPSINIYSTFFRIKIMLADKADQRKNQIEFPFISVSSVNTTSVAQAADNYVSCFICFQYHKKMCVCSLSMLDFSQQFETFRYFNTILRDSNQFFLSLFFCMLSCSSLLHMSPVI